MLSRRWPVSEISAEILPLSFQPTSGWTNKPKPGVQRMQMLQSWRTWRRQRGILSGWRTKESKSSPFFKKKIWITTAEFARNYMCSFSSAIFLQPGTTWVQWTPTVWPSGSTERSQLCFQTGLRVTWSCGIFTRPLRIRLRSEFCTVLHNLSFPICTPAGHVFSSAHTKLLDYVWF